MEHGFRPLKAGKMHPNALKTLPSGAARDRAVIAGRNLRLLVLLEEALEVLQ
jgi:hypothetical protein